MYMPVIVTMSEGNGLNLAGAKNDVQYIVIGSVIILAVTIDVFRNKMEAKARKMAAQ